MKTNTMKWRILKSNIIVMLGFIVLTIVVFNITIRLYIERDTREQLLNIALQAEETTLRKGPDFLSDRGNPPPPKDKEKDKEGEVSLNGASESNEIYEFYFMLDRSLRETSSVLNADYILIDNERNIINSNKGGYFNAPENLMDAIDKEFTENGNLSNEPYLKFKLSGTEYIAIATSVSNKNSFGLGWIIVYSSLQKLNQLQLVINVILFLILVLFSLLIVVCSSIIAKKISAPFSSLSHHLAGIAERNFRIRMVLPVDDELKEVVKNINLMAEKLETYDKAQQTFFQNVSHEFRTPLMSIQSYAEGIKYEVIDSGTALDIIIQETNRMTNLVEDLIYLSRLDTLEESYHFSPCNISHLIKNCIDRMQGITIKSNISISFNSSADNIFIFSDEEKLSRAITNIIANDIRYAAGLVKIDLKISDSDNTFIDISILDDGSGFDPKELPNIFDRFYKGKKGNFGLGLAIAKNVIEKHNGQISAFNTESGALFIIKLPISNQ